MQNNTTAKFLTLILLAVFAAGCGIKAETYVMTKERADITSTSGGNGGFLMGKPQYTEPQKKTRKVYVLELTKPIPEKEVKKIEQQVAARTHEEAATESAEHGPAPAAAGNKGFVGGAPQAAAVEGPKEAVTYTVQKDDTLQKIAKKFYGSYGKWYRIYKANQDKIKNPNVVRPGTVLTIPAAQEKK